MTRTTNVVNVRNQPIDIEKNKREYYRLQRTEYKGTPLIDLRVYFRSVDKPTEGFPTRKGVSIPLDHVKPVVEALTALYTQENISTNQADQ